MATCVITLSQIACTRRQEDEQVDIGAGRSLPWDARRPRRLGVMLVDVQLQCQQTALTPTDQ